MPTLEWIGKDKVINHHQEVPFRVLEERYTYGAESENLIVHGDNLEVLKALLPRYEGRVKCVYIDPPYNTGNEGWVYNDNVNDPKIRKWLGEVVGREGEDLTRHDKWLCMMYPRLKLLQQLLAEDGVIFISIDDNELYNLKSVCDEIFGASCFVSTVSWQRTYSTRNDSKGIVSEVEHILVYSKKPGWNPNKLPRTDSMNAKYKNPDNDKAPWRASDAFAADAATHQRCSALHHPANPKCGGPSQPTSAPSAGGNDRANASHQEAGGKQRTPPVSACKPPCAISSSRAGQFPWKKSRTKTRRFTRDERKAGESPGAFRALGQVLLPAVRAVAGTGADAFLTGEKTD